jgi:hypothetical protein
MSKSLDKGMWPDYCYIFKQLPRIGDKFSKCLYRAGYTSFEKIREETNPRMIENICGKNPPFGNIILDAAKSLPIMNFKYEIDFYKDIYKIILDIKCQWNKTSSYTYLKNEINEYFDSYSTYHIISVDNSGDNKIIYKKKVRPSQKGFKLFINGLKEVQFPITIFFISDKFIGLDKILSIESKNDKEGKIFSLYNGNLTNIINKINNCIVDKSNEKKGKGNESKLDENIMREIEKENILEKEFDIKINKDNITPKKSKSLSKNKRKKRQKIGKKLKNNNSDMDIDENSEISNNKIDTAESTDKTQLKITKFTNLKINNETNIFDNEKDDKFHISEIYGEDNAKSTEKKINQLLKKKEKKSNKKDKKISTKKLINDLNNMDKNEEEYNFEFLNKYEKFDNDTNSIFDLFNAPKNKKNNIKNDDDGNNISDNNKIEKNETNKNSDLMFLNTIEDLNNLM